MIIDAIIPARGGSKGISGKNLVEICGKPMIAYSIEQAQQTAEITEVFVSTDSGDIAEVARSGGATVIDRPAEISGDTASSESALLHALDEIRPRRGCDPDIVVFLQATSPLRPPEAVGEAVRTLIREGADSLFSASPVHGFVWRRDPGGPAPVNYDPASRPRRQECMEHIEENGSIYVFKPWVLREGGSRLGGKIAVSMMDPVFAAQVDEPEDLNRIGALIRQHGLRGAASNERIEEAVFSDGNFEATTAGRFYARRPCRPDTTYGESDWTAAVDPDGNLRDRTLEREQHLDDLRYELHFVNALPPGRILDIGCGLGFFLSGIDDAWEKHGIEMSQFAVDHAGQWGRVLLGPVEAAAFPAAHFEVVVMHHVIEHIEDPERTLAEVERILKPGGHLIMATPDFDSACARRFGSRYRLLHDPTHISLFSNESMHRFLRDSGFLIEFVDYPFFDTRHFNEENLLKMLEKKGVSPPFYGSFMTFYCRKPEGGALTAAMQKLGSFAFHELAVKDRIAAAMVQCMVTALDRGPRIRIDTGPLMSVLRDFVEGLWRASVEDWLDPCPFVVTDAHPSSFENENVVLRLRVVENRQTPTGELAPGAPMVSVECLSGTGDRTEPETTLEIPVTAGFTASAVFFSMLGAVIREVGLRRTGDGAER